MPWTMTDKDTHHSGIAIIVAVFVYAIIFTTAVTAFVKFVGG